MTVKEYIIIGFLDVEEAVKIQRNCKKIVIVDIKNGATISFLHDIWRPRRRLIHRPRRHVLEKYNIVEGIIEEQQKRV